MLCGKTVSAFVLETPFPGTITAPPGATVQFVLSVLGASKSSQKPPTTFMVAHQGGPDPSGLTTSEVAASPAASPP